MKLGELASRLGLALAGPADPEREVTGVGPLESAGTTDVTYVAEPRFAPLLASSRAGAVICAESVASGATVPCLVSAAPGADFARTTRLFYTRPRVPLGVDPLARLAPSATVGNAVRIGPFSTIGEGASIGDDVEIGPNVTIYPSVRVGDGTVIHAGCVLREGTVVGARCLLQPNVVLGSDGFGYARRTDGSYERIEQMGVVEIEDDVEIGAGTTVDRATFGVTRIGRGSKLDNLVQIGHNSTVGENAVLCAQVGLAGSTTIGRGVTLAGQVGVAGHLTVGDGAVATAQTGIPSSVEPGRVVSGYPAMDNRGWLKSSAVFARLPDIHRLLRRLEARVDALEGRRDPP